MRNLLLFLLLSCALPLASFAQTDIDSLLSSIDLDDVVVTAQYKPLHYKRAVHPVRVISAAEIKKQGFNTLDELLAFQVNMGVGVDMSLGSSLSMQGLGGENVQILIDGVPVIGRLDGNVDISQINLNHIQRIEIIQGALAAQYGSNAAGGVINIITRQSQLQALRLQSTHQYDAVGIHNHSLQLGWQPDKNWYAHFGINYQQHQLTPVDSLRNFVTDTLRTASGIVLNQRRQTPWLPKLQNGMDAKLRYRLSDSASISYQFRYFDEELQELGNMRRPKFKPYAFDNVYFTNRVDHSLQAQAYLSPFLYLNTSTSYNNYERRKEATRYDFEADSSSFIAAEQDTTTFSNFLHRSVLSSTLPGVLNGQLGLEYMHETGTGQRIVDSTSSPINESQITNYAMWLGVQLRLKRTLQLEANLRIGNNSTFDHPLLPSLNARWQATPNWTLRLNYAHAFRAPTLKEMHLNFIDINHFIVGNANLKPEYARNLNFQTEYTISKGKNRMTLEANFFHNVQRDRIMLFQLDTIAQEYTYRNVGTFETHGANLRFSYRHADRFQFSSALAHTRVLNLLHTNENNAQKFLPTTELINELRYRIPQVEVEFNVLHRFTGRRIQYVLNSEGGLQQGYFSAFHMLNATFSRSFYNDHIAVTAGVKNILDVTDLVFSESGGTGLAHSASSTLQPFNWGRNFFIRLALSF